MIDNVYQEEFASTFTHNGIEYGCNELFKIAHNLNATQINIDLVKWCLGEYCLDPYRIDSANISIPIITTISIVDGEYQLFILDGTHRAYKAITQGVQTIPCKIIEECKLLECLRL